MKNFKGQVKISDVQEAFDEVVGNINSLVDTYNKQSFVKEIDYTIGGEHLAPSGYTLTVGGYKELIEAAEGCVVGGKPFRVDDNHLKLTTGMLVARNGIFRLPDSVLPIPTDDKYRTVYYNTYTKEYQWTGTGTISYVVTKEVQLGSNLYKCSSANPDVYLANSTAYNDYSTERAGEVIYSGSGGTYASHQGRFMIFEKINKDIPLINNKIPLTINDYAYIPIENRFNYDTSIQIDWSKKGIPHDDSYYSNFTPSFVLGTLETDGITFIPKLIVCLYTGYPNHDSVSLSIFPVTGVDHELPDYYSSRPPHIHEGIVVHANHNSAGSVHSGSIESGAMYSGITLLSFEKDEVSDKDLLVLNHKTNGDFVRIGECQLPESLKDYDFNVLFMPRVPANKNNVVTDNEPSVCVDSNNVIVKTGSKENKIVTDTRTVTITEVVTEEVDNLAYRICDFNTNSDSKFLGVDNRLQCEDINGTYKITNESKDYSGKWVKEGDYTDSKYWNSPWYQELDTSTKPKFVIGMPAVADGTSKHGGGSIASCFLFGEEVYLNDVQRDRANQYWCPATYLYIPKGVNNPYTYFNGRASSTDPKFSSQKILNVKIDKQIQDSSG